MEWKNIKFGEYSTFKGGKQPPKSSFSYLPKDGYVRLLQIRDFGERAQPTYVSMTNNLTYVEPEDILIARYGASVGKILTGLTGAINVAIIKTEPQNGLYKRYLYHFLKTSSFQSHIKSIPGRMAQAGFDKSALVDIEIPLPFTNGKPDIAEQKRIADGLDAILLLQEKSNDDIQNADNLFSTITRRFIEENSESSHKINLGDDCKIVKGQSPTLKTPEGKYTFVVTSEKRRTANTYQFDGEAVCIPLVSSTGHGHASLHRIHYQNGKFALGNILVALAPKNTDKLLTKYLYYYLSFYKDDLLVPLMRGVANVTIPLYKISDVVIEVPEINKQKELISTLEETERLKESLTHRQTLVAQYFQSSLNLAFSKK